MILAPLDCAWEVVRNLKNRRVLNPAQALPPKRRAYSRKERQLGKGEYIIFGWNGSNAFILAKSDMSTKCGRNSHIRQAGNIRVGALDNKRAFFQLIEQKNI